MDRSRFDLVTGRYRSLRIALIGDVCLDRYLEIDPALATISIETGLPVRHVVSVRSAPGGAGTVLNNLAALGIGAVDLVGSCGEDGEGFELQQALRKVPGLCLDGFAVASGRRTFCYTKPLLLHPGRPPEELERLDILNRAPTPAALAERLAQSALTACRRADAVVVMEQVDHPGTGTVCPPVLAALARIAAERPTLPIVADSRIGLHAYPPAVFKMNGRELARMLGLSDDPDLAETKRQATVLAARNRRAVVVTLAERGIVGAMPDGAIAHVTSLPLRGPIDVVGAGDSVTANLTAALAGGATLGEAVELANAAASVVIHQLGTTGTAATADLRALAVR